MDAAAPNPDMVAPRRGRPPNQTPGQAAIESLNKSFAPDILGRDIAAVHFKDGGVQFLANVKSGLNAKKDNCDITLVSPGVFITIGGRDYLVPFGNINRIDFAA